MLLNRQRIGLFRKCKKQKIAMIRMVFKIEKILIPIIKFFFMEVVRMEFKALKNMDLIVDILETTVFMEEELILPIIQ